MSMCLCKNPTSRFIHVYSLIHGSGLEAKTGSTTTRKGKSESQAKVLV